MVGDFALKLAELTDYVLFGDIWARAELSQRDRSLVAIAALIANGNTEQLPGHLSLAKANGLAGSEMATTAALRTYRKPHRGSEGIAFATPTPTGFFRMGP